MIVVVMVTVCARDHLQKLLFIMLKLCLVPDVAYYARFSARLIMWMPIPCSMLIILLKSILFFYSSPLPEPIS